MSKKKILVLAANVIDPPAPKPLTDARGLTREGALAAARERWGDLGTISMDERMPRLVWKIGFFYATVGKGRSWEEALRRADRRAAKRAPQDRDQQPVA